MNGTWKMQRDPNRLLWHALGVFRRLSAAHDTLRLQLLRDAPGPELTKLDPSSAGSAACQGLQSQAQAQKAERAAAGKLNLVRPRQLLLAVKPCPNKANNIT